MCHAWIVCALVTESCPIHCDLMVLVHQAPLSMGFSRQEYWSGLPCPSPGDLLDPQIEPRSLALQADFLPSVPPGKLVYRLCAVIMPFSIRDLSICRTWYL